MAEHMDGGHASIRAGTASLAAAPAGASSARSLWTTQRTALPFVNQLRLRVRAAEWWWWWWGWGAEEGWKREHGSVARWGLVEAGGTPAYCRCVGKLM